MKAPRKKTATFRARVLKVAVFKILVPTARLELAQLSPLPPQDSVSTNSTTSAILLVSKARYFSMLLTIYSVVELETGTSGTSADDALFVPEPDVAGTWEPMSGTSEPVAGTSEPAPGA